MTAFQVFTMHYIFLQFPDKILWTPLYGTIIKMYYIIGSWYKAQW